MIIVRTQNNYVIQCKTICTYKDGEVFIIVGYVTDKSMNLLGSYAEKDLADKVFENMICWINEQSGKVFEMPQDEESEEQSGTNI